MVVIFKIDILVVYRSQQTRGVWSLVTVSPSFVRVVVWGRIMDERVW